MELFDQNFIRFAFASLLIGFCFAFASLQFWALRDLASLRYRILASGTEIDMFVASSSLLVASRVSTEKLCKRRLEGNSIQESKLSHMKPSLSVTGFLNSPFCGCCH